MSIYARSLSNEKGYSIHFIKNAKYLLHKFLEYFKKQTSTLIILSVNLYIYIYIINVMQVIFSKNWIVILYINDI